MKLFITLLMTFPLYVIGQKFQIFKADAFYYNNVTEEYESDNKMSHYQNSFFEITSNTISFSGEELNMDIHIKTSYKNDDFLIYTCDDNGWISRLALSLDKPMAIMFYDYVTDKDMFKSYLYLVLE